MTGCVTYDGVLASLKEGNALYYQSISSQEGKDKNQRRRVKDLLNAAQFPELRVKHQQVWLEAVGIQLLEAMNFMRHGKTLGEPSCVWYLKSVAERAPFRITLKNGCLNMLCLFCR